MGTERPNKDEIFNAAAELDDAEQRAAFLDQACAGDSKLKAEIVQLLEMDGGDDSLLDVSAPGLMRTEIRPLTESPGDTIGPYKLLQQIGEGGMGVVYMAVQSEPVKRRVALKIIKPGMDTRQVIARFEAERQALSLMDHPHIAKVLDAGTTASGRPFFVMELVKGQPITQYCNEHLLTPRQRLELLLPVCQAIQHAHQKGIIHRDIKPTNILVAEYDLQPVPKVIDFGVAKATGQTLTEKTMFTGLGQIVGTLEYMSPEQAKVNQLDIDTRSDIYSLGVLLYELLTGSTPFDRKRLQSAAWDEMLRIIREEEPPKPSTRLSDAHDSLPSISAQRHTEPAKLTKLVRGELDWIVMKALEKDRNRRYETANAFAADMQRYLADEPVQACPPSAWYRLQKFARRNKGPAAAVGLVLLALVGGIAGTTWGLLRAEQQRQLAEAKKQEAVDERDAKDVALKAEQQARADEAKARQQVFTALRSMTAGVVEKKFTQGTALTEDDRVFLHGVIAQYDAFAAIKGDDADSRAARAEGRFRVAKMRHTLGEHKEAGRDYEQALSIQKQLAADLPNRPEFRLDLAKTHNNRGILLNDTGRLKEAEQDLDQALTILKQLAAEFPSRSEFRHLLANTHVNRGRLLKDTGRLDEAEQDYDRALSIQKQLAADFSSTPKFLEVAADSHMTRGLLLRATGQFKEAEQDYDRALSIWNQLVAEFPSRSEFRQDLAGIHTNRGNLLSEMGRLKEAKLDYEQALSLLKQLAADFPSRPVLRRDLAAMHGNQGNLLRRMGRKHDAGHEYEQAVSIQKQLAADFPSQLEFRGDLAMGHINRGNLLQETGWLKEAQPQYDQAVAILKQLVADFPSRPEFRQSLAKVLANRGILLKDTDRLNEAQQDLDQAVSIQMQLAADFPYRPEFRHELAKSHGRRGNVLSEMSRGELRSETDRQQEAEREYDQSVIILTQLAAEFPVRPEFRQELATGLLNRGSLLRETSRLKEAQQDFEQALSISKQLGDDFPNDPELQNNLAHTYIKLAFHQQQQGDWAAAKRLLLEGRPHHLAALKANPQNRTYSLYYCGHLSLLTQVHAGLLEQEDAVRAAETFRDLGHDPPQDAYVAAGLLAGCIPFVARHDKLDEKQRQEAVQFYGDAAMGLLRDAVSKGYDDLPELKKSAGLDPLRQREDFLKLVVELVLAQARSHGLHGQWDKAAAGYAEAIELKPDDYQARNQLAWLYATCPDPQFRRPHEAVALAEEAVAAAAQDADGWNTLGVARYRAGDWPGAVAALQKFRELRTSDLEWSNPFFLAMAHWRLGNADEARRWRDTAVAWMESWAPKNDNLRRFRTEMEEVMRQKPEPDRSEKKPR